MISKRIDGATRVVGREQGYLSLALRDEPIGDPAENCMVTSWEPTPDELKALNCGGHVYIRILGRNHPPIGVGVQ